MKELREFQRLPIGAFFIIPPTDGPCPLYYKIDERRARSVLGGVEELAPDLIVLLSS